MTVPQYTFTSAIVSVAGSIIGPPDTNSVIDTHVFLTRWADGPGQITVTTNQRITTQNPTGNLGGSGFDTESKLFTRSGAIPRLYSIGGSDRSGNSVQAYSGVLGYRRFTWTPCRPDRPIGGTVPNASKIGVQQTETSTNLRIQSWQLKHEPGVSGTWRARRRPRTRDCLWNVHRKTQWGGPTDPFRTDSLVLIGRVDFP